MFDVKPVTTKADICCGPTCLKMLLDYYGVEVDLDTLIKECNPRVIGSSATELCHVARAHGIDLAAYQMPSVELIRQDRPGIVWWRYNHWIVFCGKNDEGNVVICNPCSGRFSMDQESFSKLCTGLEDGKLVALCNGMPSDLPETPTTAERVSELEDAVVELAAMSAEHDDAIVELADLIEGGK